MGYGRDGKTSKRSCRRACYAVHLGGDGFEGCPRPRRADLNGFIVVILPMDTVRRKWTMGK